MTVQTKRSNFWSHSPILHIEKFTFLKGMLTLVTVPGRSHTARKRNKDIIVS